MSDYEKVFRASVDDPEAFWLGAAEAIDWSRRPTRALDSSNPPFYRWFPDGELNVCFNALDRHVDAGRGDQAALIYDSPVTGTGRTYSYAELRDEVARFAGVLAGSGSARATGSSSTCRWSPRPSIAMLACARIGAVHSVVFGGFAPRELAARIDDATPKVIVSASCGIEGKRVIEYKPLLDQAIELADAQARPLRDPAAPAGRRGARPARRRLGRGDGGAPPRRIRCRSRPPTRCTSCTPRAPPASPRAWSATPAATRSRWPGRCANIYDIGPGEVMFTASDVGWVVGHSYIVYGPLLAGATTVLYEGKPVGTPDAGQFWRVVAEHGVKSLFTAPTAFRAIKQGGSAGRAARPVRHLEPAVPVPGRRTAGPGDLPVGRPNCSGIPVIDHWWQTESGWAIVADPAGIELLPIKPGSPTRPMPGWDVRILDAAGEPRAGRRGRRDRRQAAAAAGRAADPVERRRAVRRAPTCRPIPATTSPATAGTWTPTATCS